VLDLIPPGRDGFQVLQDLRQAGKTLAILILTAHDAIEDRVLGLDAGAWPNAWGGRPKRLMSACSPGNGGHRS